MIDKTISSIIIIIITFVIVFIMLYPGLLYGKNTNIEGSKEGFKDGLKVKSGNVNYVDQCDETDINISYNDCKHLLSKKSKYQQIDVYNHPAVGNILVIDDDLQITASGEKFISYYRFRCTKVG